MRTRSQTSTVPKDGTVLLGVYYNHRIDDITVTGSDQVEMWNSNFGHLYTSYVSPHVFPSVILRKHIDATYFHDLYFEAKPGDVITITWRETYVPYGVQSSALHGDNMYTGELVKI